MAVLTRRASLSFISRVPDDILIEIFNYVPLRDRIRSQRVCRRFRDVLNRHGWKGGHVFDYTSLKFLFTVDEWREFMDSCETEWNWRSNTDLWAPGKARNALSHIESFFQRMGPFLKELDMATNIPLILVDYCWTVALRRCTQLEKLKIGFDDSWALSLLALFGCKCIFGNLVEIDFARTDTDPLTDWGRAADSICPFLKGNQQLRVLSLSNFPGDIDRFLIHLPQSLEELNIKGDTNSNSFSSCSWPALLKAKERCPGLRKFSFTAFYTCDAETVDCPFDVFERLESLKFSGEGLDVTFRDMPELRECYLDEASYATDRTVETLCVAAPNLVVLQLDGIGELSSSALGKISNLRRLEKLSVNHVSEFNDGVIDAIARHGLLTHVSMCSTSVSDVGIQSLLQYCEHLAFIDVSLTSIGEESANYLGEYTRRLNKRLRVKLTCGMDEPPGDRVRFYEHVRSVLFKYKLIDLDPSRCGHEFNYTSLEYLFTQYDWRELMYELRSGWDWRWNSYLWAPVNTKKARSRLESFFKRMGPFLTDLDVATNFPGLLLDHCWKLILAHCSTQLQKLKIGIDDDWALSHLERIGEKFPHLVEVEFARTDPESMTDEEEPNGDFAMISSFLADYQGLRVLRLTKFYGDIDRFLPNFPSALEELDITGDPISYSQCSWQVLLDAKEKCPRLKKLTLLDIGICGAETIDCPFDMFEQLESLRFRADAFESFIFRDMPALTECYLGGESGATDRTVETLCAAAPNLAILSLRNLKDLSWSLGKISNLKSLKKLCLNHVSKFNDDMLDAIARNGLLTYIYMCSTAVTDVGIQALLKYCEHLAYVDVSLTRIGEASAHYIGEYTTRLNKHLRVKVTCSPDKPPEDRAHFDECRLRYLMFNYKLIDIDFSCCAS